MKVSGGRVVVGVDHLVLEVLTNSSSQNCNGSTSSLNASARRVEDSHASLRNIVRDTFAKVTLSHQLDMRQDSTRYLWAAILVLLFLLLLLCAALALAVFFPTKWSGRNPLQRLRASFFRQKKTRRLSEGWQASSPSSESDGVKESLPPIRYDLSWCSPADAPQATCLLKASIHFVERPWTSSSVTRVLHDYEVHSSKWTDTAINGMVTELNEGKARLYSIDGSLLRSVDIVRVFVVCKDDHPLVLHVSSRPPPKHSFVHFEGPREIAQPLQGRMLPDESPETCARRCLSEKLNVPSGFIEVRPEVTQVHEECEDYLPGLSNHARFYTVRADVVSKKTSHLEQIGMTKGRLSSNGYKCKWLSINDSEFQKIFQPPGRCFKASLFSTRAESILPWSEQDVRKLCAQHGAEYIVLPKTEPQAKPISTTSILANIRAPQRVPLRVDFGGGWLDVPRHARTGAYIVNCSISPLVSLDEWEYEKSGGLGGSGAYALLCGKDGVRSEVEELGVGWQDPAVIAETGLCVWRSGKRPELAFKTDAAMLEGRMILFWTGIQHDTPAQADKARNYRIIEAAGSLASQGVRSDSLSLLIEGVKLSYIAQRGEGMPQLDFPDSEGNADFSRVRYDLDQSLKEESVSNSNGYHNGKISTESIPRKSPDSTVGRAVTSVIGSGARAPHASPGEGQDFCEQLMPPGVLACKYCGGGWGGYAVLICDSTNSRDKLAAACPAQYRVIEPFIKFRC